MTTMTDVRPIEVQAVRRAQREFLTALDPVRPELHAYCRRLTGDVWDAEDLVQETLARALGRAAASHAPIQSPIAWLVRIATNAYIDGRRRPRQHRARSLIGRLIRPQIRPRCATRWPMW